MGAGVACLSGVPVWRAPHPVAAGSGSAFIAGFFFPTAATCFATDVARLLLTRGPRSLKRDFWGRRCESVRRAPCPVAVGSGGAVIAGCWFPLRRLLACARYGGYLLCPGCRASTVDSGTKESQVRLCEAGVASQSGERHVRWQLVRVQRLSLGAGSRYGGYLPVSATAVTCFATVVARPRLTRGLRSLK